MSSDGGPSKRKRGRPRVKSQPDTDEVFEVETIRGAQFMPDNSLKLLVKWEGYKKLDWQPVKNFTGASIKDFVDELAESLTHTLEQRLGSDGDSNEAPDQEEALEEQDDQEGPSTLDHRASSALAPHYPPPSVFGQLELDSTQTAKDSSMLVGILGGHKEPDGSERYFVRLFNNETEYWSMEKVKKSNPHLFKQFHKDRRDELVMAPLPF